MDLILKLLKATLLNIWYLINIKIKNILILLICFMTLTSHGQIDTRFNDKNTYFKFINKKYKIDSTSIYYTTDSTKKTIFLFPSFTYFIRK